MANPKDIGKAFKEKLEGFNATPSQLSWEDIESKLPKKEKRPLIYWVRIGSALVLSSLLLVFGYLTYTETNIKKTDITNQNTPIDHCEETNFNNGNVTYTEGSKNNTKDSLETLYSKKGAIDTRINSTTNTVSNASKDKNHKINNNANLKANASKLTSRNTSPKRNSSTTNTYTQRNTPASKKSSKNIDHSTSNNTNSSLASSTSKNKNIGDRTPKNSSLLVKTLKDSLPQDSIVTKESIVNNRNPKDTLLFLKPKKKKKALFQKFSLGFHLTPTYTFTPKGSLLSNRIANNKNNGRISLSYGILFKTYYSKKTALRIGYNRTKLNSITKNISSDQIEIALRDAGTSLPNNVTLGDSNVSNLIQKISYNEISLGAQHQIIDQKVKTSILMGMNILFLDRNTLSIRNSSNTINIGSARNLEKISSNFYIGANFQYPITKHIYLNTEPIFNFQLKDASSNTESYRHLFFTLQTGLSYKF